MRHNAVRCMFQTLVQLTFPLYEVSLNACLYMHQDDLFELLRPSFCAEPSIWCHTLPSGLARTI